VRKMRDRGYSKQEIRALAALTPAAASGLRTIGHFLEQVEYNSGRLAKLNMPPSEALEALRDFDGLLGPMLSGHFEPAREQLRLATSLILNQAYFQVRETEAHALFGIYRAEAEAPELAEFLRRLVRILTPALRARAGRIVILEEPARGKLTQALYVERGQRAEALLTDEAVRGKYESFWSYPLTDTVLAQFGFAVKYPWLPRELALLNAAAERVQAASERARLRAENRQLEEQALRAEEEERKRIGRELHDETGQSLLLLRLQLEMMQRDAPEGLRKRLTEARGIAENAVAEVRRIVAALSPAILERLGLEAAVRHLVTRFQKRCPIEVKLTIDLSKRPIPNRVRDAVYRVTQESLENISRHSGAKKVKVLLESSDGVIKLAVSDDGQGFPTGAAGKPMSFGLSGMRQRAALLGGNVTVKTAAGRGVKVALEIPLVGEVKGKSDYE
jgi:signal transduction histidine kinase